MVELTIGYVSGIIAAAVFLTQLFIPIAISLVVVGLINEQHSAVSWSVVSRLIHSSYWPVIVGADSAASTGVSRRVQLLAWLQPLLLALVAIAAIVTPLGLYDQLAPSDDTVSVLFQYVPDTSAFGKATPKRSGHKSLRICYDTDEGCPGAPPDIDDIEDYTEAYQVWPSSIDLFTSGKTAPTISSIFDIEWRSYSVSEQVAYNHTGSSFAKGFYRKSTNFILHETVEAVEGLLVDTIAGRVGFRNHTLPVDIGLGVEWTEDILFMEPESRCVNTNLTIDYRLEGGAFQSINMLNSVLVDQGGFINIDHTEPEVDSRDFQTDPDLYGRAYSIAWNLNMLAMQYFNVTTNGSDGLTPFSYLNSYAGKKFDVLEDEDDTWSFVEPNTIRTAHSYQFLKLPSDYEFSSNTSFNFSRTVQTGPNPLNITYSDFIRIGREKCKLPTNDDRANMSAVGAACGIVYGVHTRTDGGNHMSPDANSTWSVPIYSCATATKATIKQVAFRLNETGGLSNLIIDRIDNKSYQSRAEMPLWGVENLKNFTIQHVRPLWGIVSPEVGDREDVSTIQREYLWLPGYPEVSLGEPISVFTGESNMPGNIIFMSSVDTAYTISTVEDETSGYTGMRDFALHEKWRELSHNATGTEQILKLIWTDLMANSVVGTRSWLSNGLPNMSNRDLASKSAITADVPVTLWSRTIKYHMAYAIPAVISLFITLLIASTTFLLLILGRTGTEMMKTYLAQTSAGRILGTFLYPGLGDPLAPRRIWIAQVGVQPVNLARGKNTVGGRADLGSGPLYSNVPLSEEAVDMGQKMPPT